MQNVIKIYHVVQELSIFSLTANGQTDGWTHKVIITADPRVVQYQNTLMIKISFSLRNYQTLEFINSTQRSVASCESPSTNTTQQSNIHSCIEGANSLTLFNVCKGLGIYEKKLAKHSHRFAYLCLDNVKMSVLKI